MQLVDYLKFATHMSVWACAALLAISVAAVPSRAATSMPKPTPVQDTSPATGLTDEVRRDFARGLSGDADALDRAMAAGETAIAANPENAEALVWHGSGLIVRAGRAFMAGNFEQGGTLWTRGHDEMDRAVSLEPENPMIRIPRGTVLIESSRSLPDPGTARQLLEKGVGDYEKVFSLDAQALASLPAEVRGQLLLRLARAWERLGEPDRAREYFERVASEFKGTELERQASIALDESH